MGKSRKIDKILIANRGEIARRVIRTCHRLGIQTVSLYTRDEEELPHAREAGESYCLGEGTLAETYLNQEKILDIASSSGATAIHPGYGLLSENSEFATTAEKQGITFIGPRSDSISLMGDKQRSKIEMEKIGVPTIPGYHGEKQDQKTLISQSKKMGFPLMIKAAAGGGGVGIRVVNSEGDFLSSLESAKREAKASFGDDKILLEKSIVNPRHIEVQTISDDFGNHLHIFERECSIQRRRQKIVEETPSPGIDNKKRDAMFKEAVKIASHINYRGVGTVEFILDEKGNFYFLEMNTRLQVEHPITEMITGLDLVELQILIAEGKELPIKQADILRCGHAIEVRLCAENPDNQFLPSTGTIEYLGYPKEDGTRFDSGYESGNRITVQFDSMLAKLIVCSSNRASAIDKMVRALSEVPLLGLKSNRDYLRRILSHHAFASGETTTDFVNKYSDDLLPTELSSEEKAMAVAAYMFSSNKGSRRLRSQKSTDNVWQRLGGFRNA